MNFLMLLVSAFVIGAITPVYLPMNSTVARYVGSPMLANVSFFLMALGTTLVAVSLTFIFSSNLEGSQIIVKYKQVPFYLYLSGSLSALFILGTTFLIPRLGASTFFVVFISGQVIMATIISHFGILESPQELISWQKIIGILLLIIGVALSTFKEVSWLPNTIRDISSTL